MSAAHPPPPPARRSCLIPALVVLFVAALIALGLWWRYHRPIEPVNLTPQESEVLGEKIRALESTEPAYLPGSKEIIFTERELNGLLHQNTDLGNHVHFELATDALHARLESDLDPSLPLIGGRKLKARARFFVRMEGQNPSLVLDDLTVWGISLPNDWLAGVKGRDLLENLFGESDGARGIKDLRLEPGRLILHLAD
jgi:hypothetical protein